MNRLSSICLAASVLLAGPALADEPPVFQFGLESRFGEPVEFSRSDYSWGLIPNFSYQLSERFRLDAFAGFSWSDSGAYSLSLQPGFRYYLTPPTRKLRWNSGLAVGFTVLEEGPDTTVTPDGRTIEVPSAHDDVWLRVVPIEAEYWTHRRWGWTFALDYQTRFGDRDRIDDEGFGIAAGFRYRIR